MDLTAILAFLGAVLGALLTGVATESYKRQRERHGVASAIDGEIRAILEMTRRRKYVEYYAACAKDLRAGNPVAITDTLRRPLTLDPIMASVTDRIGVLGEDLPGQVVTFYTRIMGIRLDLLNLADGKWDGNLDSKRSVIEEDLALWSETAVDAEKLCATLRAIVAEKWLWFFKV
jgi:hypothetical protein